MVDLNNPKETTRTNVVYLNTNCNLRCEYCYEEDSRTGLDDQANCTEEMIDSFLYEIREREGDLNSCVVVMGGEPLLKFDLYEYLVRKASTIPKLGGWAIPMTTNSLLFLDEKLIYQYKELRLLVKKSNVHLFIEVSYDGSGQYRRKFPNGENSKKHVERAIDNLVNNNVSFSISYTIHSGNHKDVVNDMIDICEKWPSCSKISLSFAYADLDSGRYPGYVNVLKRNLQPRLKNVFLIYNIPFCNLTCDLCCRCDTSKSVGNAYLSPTTGISYDSKETKKKFSQF